MDKKQKFGELHLDDFSVGDIVEWSAWSELMEAWVKPV